MSKNVGAVDRLLRIVVGLLLIGAALGLYGPDYASPLAWIGVVPLATGLLSWCPAYTIFGLSTCRS